MKKKQILLTDVVTLNHNYGSQAITLPLVEKLSKHAQCTLVLAPNFFQKNLDFAKKNHLSIISEPNPIMALAKYSTFFEISNTIRNTLFRLKSRAQIIKQEENALKIFLQHLKTSNLVLDATGIEFIGNTRPQTKWSQFLRSAYTQIVVEKENKPYLKYTKSYGPFQGIIYRLATKSLLNRLPYLLVRRGSGTEDNEKILKHLGIKKTIYAYPDISLILKPASPAWAKKYLRDIGLNFNKPIIGLSASAVIRSLPDEKSGGVNHVKLFLKIIDVFQKKNQILLLPHALGNNQNPKTCDLALTREIFEALPSRKNVYFLEDETLTYREARAIIGLLDFYICGRFHGVASALNMAVPVVPLAWHIKYQDLMSLFLKKYPVIDSRQLTINQAMKIIQKYYDDRTWFDRQKVVRRKKEIVEKIRESIKLIMKEI